MQIDARNSELKELLLELRDILQAGRSAGVDIEILIDSPGKTRQVTTFASMSGCQVEIDKKEEYYIMHITGTPCCT